MADRARLIGLIIAEALVVGGLHVLARLDEFAVIWSDLGGWLEDTAFEDAFGAVLLLVALAIAYWLLVSTVSYLAASISGHPALLGGVRWLTLPPIRRLVSRAAALSIAVSAVTGPLAPAVARLTGAVDGTRLMVVVDTGRWFGSPGPEQASADDDGDGSDVIVPPHLRGPPATDPADAGEVSETDDHATIEDAIPGTVKVRRGDHLWSISQRHLGRVLERSSLAEYEIARYWVRVIEANRATIRSGDPDLIYPGEIIMLPAVDPVS